MPKRIYQESKDEACNLVSRWVDKALTLAGMTQAEAARKMGLTRSYLCRITNGDQAISVQTLVRILDGCGLEITELRCKKK